MKTTLPTLRNRFKTGLAGVLAATVLTGCFVAEAPSHNTGDEIAVRLRMGIGSVTELGKTAEIKMSKLIIVYSSSANDTIRDTVFAPSLLMDTVSTTGQTVTKSRTLTALRTWRIKVESRDRLDSTIHRDSAEIPVMYAGDTAVVNLNMNSRFSMYEANFLTLPDSIQSSTPSQPKQKLCIKRLVLRVDGVAVSDSTTPLACFVSLASHKLSYDYVRTGSRNIRMVAYGPMNFYDDSLYAGSTTIVAGAGIDSTISLNLSWVGPTTGVGRINATLGRVGKVTINGTLPGTI